MHTKPERALSRRCETVENRGMAGRITPLELTTDTEMEAWSNIR